MHKKQSIQQTSYHQTSSVDNPSWLTENEPLIFWSMALLFLVPIWFSNFLPTQDGPAHLLNTYLVKQLLTGSATEVSSAFYELNSNPTPTWFLHIILSGLHFLLSPPAVEKLIVTILILSFPASARFAVKKVDPTMKPLAWLVFPIIYNHLFYYGFYGMCFSVACFLFTFGAVIGYLRTGSTNCLIMTLVGNLLCYGMHIIGLGLLGLASAIVCTGRVLMIRKRGGDKLWYFMRNRMIPLGITFLPVLLLMVLFLGEKQSVFEPEFDLAHLLDRGMYLGLSGSIFPIRFTGLAALISPGTIFSLLLFSLLLVMVRTHHLKLGMTRIMLIIFLVFCLLQLLLPQLYLVSPNNSINGGGFISHRIALFITPVFMLFLASCSNSINYFFKQFRIIIFFTVLVLGFHCTSFYHFNSYLMEYVSLGHHISQGSLFMPVHIRPENGQIIQQGPFGTSLFWRCDPLLHASNHIAVEKGAVTLDNYEPSVGYFPLLYKNGMNPLELGYEDSSIDSDLGNPVTVFKNTINHYKTKGFPVEYILVWLMGDVNLSEDLTRELSASFTVIATSKHGQLYQSNKTITGS